MPSRYYAGILAVGALALLLAIKINPVEAKGLPDNTIGAGFGVAAKPERTGPEEMDRIRAAGFSYVRYDMGWSSVEKERGVYDWDDYDKFIGELRKHHLKSVIIVDDVNGLYTEKIKMAPADSWGQGWLYAAPTRESDIRAFAAFAAAAAERYDGDDIIWEIWNEPDTSGFWPPKPNADAYSSLAAATCHAIRAKAPHATIIGPAVARLPSLYDFLHNAFFKAFIQSPAAACLDAISIHPYRNDPPETMIDDYQDKVRPFIAKYTPKGQKTLPVVDSEWGYTSSEVSLDQQTAYALRMHLSNLLAGVPLSILYEWSDTPDQLDEREMHFGLVDAKGWNKGGADLLDRLMPRIKDAMIVKRLPVEDSHCFVLLLRQPNGRYNLLAWMGVRRLLTSPKLTVKENNVVPRSYPLSLMPELINIASPAPQLSSAP